MYRIEGRIQPYAWGGKDFIPSLLKQANPEGKPFAELWLGAHTGAPSNVFLGQSAFTGLNNLIQSNASRFLGENVKNRFGQLPFLLKILDVKDMLSIQVHPSKEAAEKGFAKENHAEIPLDAPHRNYKDDNHKPEMMVALSEFWLLHGFSPAIPAILEAYAFLQPFSPDYVQGGIKGLYKRLMELPQAQVDAYLKPHADTILPLYHAGKLKKSSPDFWAARAMAHLLPGDHVDRGIFSIYLFNIVHLHPGDTIFQGSGMPHAYLEGQNIELMSNSDNVLRAGLTTKHVDVEELLANTAFVPTTVVISSLQSNIWQQVPSPVPDFQLGVIRLDPGEQIELTDPGPRILLALEGAAQWKGNNEIGTQGLAAIYALPGETIRIEASEVLTVYVASVPATSS
jgi:mannose-6-phosphate isomerase